MRSEIHGARSDCHVFSALGMRQQSGICWARGAAAIRVTRCERGPRVKVIRRTSGSERSGAGCRGVGSGTAPALGDRA
jgi:hypothetical protein